MIISQIRKLVLKMELNKTINLDKLIIKYLVLAAILFFSSCNKDNPVIIDGTPRITSIKPDSLHVGDTVIVYGELFGKVSPFNSVLLDSKIIIPSENCIKWSISEIRFRIPDSSASGFIIIKKADSLSTKFPISINPLPKFKVAEIPAGSFQMGSISGAVNEMPVRTVNITKDFFMTTYEITQRLFRTVLNYNPSIIQAEELPVDNLSWLEAAKFCNEISKIQGLDTVYRISGGDVVWNKNANGWRLPSEAEWEYACRAGTVTDYSGNGNVGDIAWYSLNSGLKAHPGGGKSANAFYLFDMSGNVWEWCYDWYDENFYSSGVNIDPSGPNTGKRHVIRGGSWNDGPNLARSSNRSIPELIPINIGFRIARNKF
jgi:formylglycine-generating enzyme required for sulfatase activity